MKNFIKIFAIAFAILASFSLASLALAEGDSSEVVPPTATLATVETVSASDISETTITLNGHIQSDGGTPILAAGFMWGTTGSYTNSISGPNNLQSDGTFKETLTGLTCGTTYNFGAFAINSVGTASGADMGATTSDCPATPQAPQVEILEAPTNISPTSATLSGIIKYEGSTPIIETGFKWGTNVNYSNIASTTNSLVKGDDFYKTLSGLTCATVYHYTVFATNSIGTGSVADATFTTSTCPPAGPSTGGSNDNEGSSGIIPSTGGSNGDEGSGIIPATGGSNNNEDTSASTEVRGDTSRNTSGGGSGSTASGNVAGNTANSCVTIIPTLRLGSKGTEVAELQTLLNSFIDAKLTVSGTFDAATKNAVIAFQTKYSNDILTPWGVTEASGIAGFTTTKKINELSCGQEFPLSSVEQYLISKYKENPQSASTTVESTTTSTTTPIEVGTNTLAPQETQTAGAANTEASGNIFQAISNFFKSIF